MIMFYDIDQVTILKSAVKLFGEGTQVSLPHYIDSITDCIIVSVTPLTCRSFKCRFYYKKGSFDPKDPNLTPA